MPQDGCRDRHFPLSYNQIDFNARPVLDCGRGCCRHVAVRGSVDTDRCGSGLDFCAMVNIFAKRRLLGPNPVGCSGRRTGHARARSLVDRCPTVRKKTADPRALDDFPISPERVFLVFLRLGSRKPTIQSKGLTRFGVVVWRRSAQNQDRDGGAARKTSVPPGKDKQRGITCLHASHRFPRRCRGETGIAGKSSSTQQQRAQGCVPVCFLKSRDDVHRI
jgi:hypothetical protein